MADLKVIVEPKGDEFAVAVTVPASRYGGQNFGALAKTLAVLRNVVPDAFDPKPHAIESLDTYRLIGNGESVRVGGAALAAEQFDTAMSDPALNHAGGDIAE